MSCHLSHNLYCQHMYVMCHYMCRLMSFVTSCHLCDVVCCVMSPVMWCHLFHMLCHVICHCIIDTCVMSLHLCRFMLSVITSVSCHRCRFMSGLWRHSYCFFFGFNLSPYWITSLWFSMFHKSRGTIMLATWKPELADWPAWYSLSCEHWPLHHTFNSRDKLSFSRSFRT